ncbi:MAG TPA: hypothetical protein VGH65_09765, partial [Verrucomicrobiaceae bacterium]
MTTLLSIMMLGFFLGMKHALDADHVVAVTTFVSRERSVFRSSLIGLIWGLGHTTTIVLVGGSIILFGLVIPHKLGLSLEFCVALMLVAVGLLNLDAFVRHLDHTSPRHHGVHHRSSSHHVSGAIASGWFRNRRLPTWIRPYLVGCVHGMAGSAALALLVLPIITDSFWAMIYLLVFGFGSVGGMMIITTIVSWPMARLGGASHVLQGRLAAGAGLLSIGLGLFLVYDIGFVQGL